MPAPKEDATLRAAVELAREAAASIAEPGTVGDHLSMEMVDERLATHYFACTARAYPGWRWAITVARVPRGKVATVCETNLVPGEGPAVPRVAAVCRAAGPRRPRRRRCPPYKEEDPNLEPGFEATGDEDVDQVALWELGLGRKRVLSAEGREAAAQRWYEGEGGPHSEVAEKAYPLRVVWLLLPDGRCTALFFGVCANAWSPSDGRVVSLDHGCGAHSEVDVDRHEPVPSAEPLVDEIAYDLV